MHEKQPFFERIRQSYLEGVVNPGPKRERTKEVSHLFPKSKAAALKEPIDGIFKTIIEENPHLASSEVVRAQRRNRLAQSFRVIAMAVGVVAVSAGGMYESHLRTEHQTAAVQTTDTNCQLGSEGIRQEMVPFPASGRETITRFVHDVLHGHDSDCLPSTFINIASELNKRAVEVDDTTIQSLQPVHDGHIKLTLPSEILGSSSKQQN